MASVSIDTSELRSLAAEMASIGGRLATEVRPIVKRGAQNIKNTMQADFRGSRHFGQVAPFISYDISGNAFYSAAEIGPRAEGAGYLENLAYFGGANGGGGTVRDPQEAANEELPNFQRELEKLASELVFG